MSDDLPILEQWLAHQRVLAAEEKRLAALAERYARGEVPRLAVDRAHKDVVEMRKLSDALYCTAMEHLDGKR